MDTLPSSASESNLPIKTCTKCNLEFPATLAYFSKQKSGLKSWCKPCSAKASAEYHAIHREEIKAQRQVYYQQHQEHLRQYSAQYRNDNPEKVKESNIRYNVEHKDKRRAHKGQYNTAHRQERAVYRAKWHQEHREYERLYSLQYNKTHREQRLRYDKWRKIEHRQLLNEQQRTYRQTERGRIMHCIHENNRRARKLAVPGVLTNDQIQQKLKAQKYCCYYAACGYSTFEKKNGKYIFHLEHTIPLSRTEHGPRHDVNYIVLACPSCNLKKNNKLPHEFWEGGRLF